MRPLTVLVGVAAAALLLALVLFDGGEVITLRTQDPEGDLHETPLWIVEVEDALFLRAGRRGARWLEELRAHPVVEVVREDETLVYRAEAVDDPAVREAVNRAMARKYGGANQLVVFLLDEAETVPVRLDPIPEGAGLTPAS